MFVHCVYFWLKPGLSKAELEQFKTAGAALTQIPSVRNGWFGTPADTNRPVIDRSYSYALVVSFDDTTGHDAYQIHPVHDAFRDLSHLWTQVKIYDFEG